MPETTSAHDALTGVCWTGLSVSLEVSIELLSTSFSAKWPEFRGKAV